MAQTESPMLPEMYVLANNDRTLFYQCNPNPEQSNALFPDNIKDATKFNTEAEAEQRLQQIMLGYYKLVAEFTPQTIEDRRTYCTCWHYGDTGKRKNCPTVFSSLPVAHFITDNGYKEREIELIHNLYLGEALRLKDRTLVRMT